MSDTRFDLLQRLAVGSPNRRLTLRTAIGAALAALVGPVTAGEAAKNGKRNGSVGPADPRRQRRRRRRRGGSCPEGQHRCARGCCDILGAPDVCDAGANPCPDGEPCVRGFCVGVLGADIDLPLAVAVAPDGEVYVTNNNSKGIFRFAAAGARLPFADVSQETVFASGLAVLRVDLFVASSLGVAKLDRAGQGGFAFPARGVTRAGALAAGPSAPLKGANVYVGNEDPRADPLFPDQVLRFDIKGGSRRFAAGRFESVTGLAVSSLGDVYVADLTAGRLFRFDEAGEKALDFGGEGIVGPAAVAVGPDDTVWVATRGAGVELLRFTRDGEPLLSLPISDSPTGVAVASDGTVYVADLNRRDLQRFVPAASSGSKSRP
jgi:hypothetical protein